MSDIFQFEKSCSVQGVDLQTPFSDKSFQYVADLNSGSYSFNSGLTLVNFDMSSINGGAQSCVNMSEAFIALPITIATAFTDSAGATLDPLENAWASTGLKSGGYINLVHGLDLSVDGKTLEQFVPDLQNYVKFKLLSEMSNDDLRTIGPSLGMGDTLDNWESMVWTPSAVNTPSGSATNALTPVTLANGISNNAPFPLNIPVVTVATSAATSDDDTLTFTSSTVISSVAVGQYVTGSGIPVNTYVVSISGATVNISTNVTVVSGADISFFSSNFGDSGYVTTQRSGTYNKGYYSRLKKLPVANKTAAAGYHNIVGSSGCINSATNLANQFRGYYTVQNKVCYWYDVAIIRCCDILDSIKQMPITKRWNSQMRLYFNTGYVVSNISNGGLLVSSGSSNTFSNSCPIMQSALQIYPNGAKNMTSAIFIGNPQTTAISTQGSTTLNLSGNSHFLNQARLYYPLLTLKPEKLEMYISSNRSKKVCFTSVLNNTFTNIASGTTSSYLVQAGISNCRSIIIIPTISSTVHGLTGSNLVTSFSQAISPYDPTGWSPVSLTNLNVALGGKNVLANVMSYSFEEFLTQVNLYERINPAEMGISCGLFDENWWLHNRVYYINLERCNISDQMTPRQLTLTFTNNSNVTIDINVFTEYYRECTIDVETSLITM